MRLGRSLNDRLADPQPGAHGQIRGGEVKVHYEIIARLSQRLAVGNYLGDLASDNSELRFGIAWRLAVPFITRNSLLNR